MAYTFFTVSILSVITMLILIFKLNKKNPEILSGWKFILSLTLFLIFVVSSVYFIFATFIDKKIEYKPLITILTVVVALISFLTSVYISNKNTDNTLENQKTIFIMNLIKNNYDLLKERENKIDTLIESLTLSYTKKTFFFGELESKFQAFLKSNSVFITQIDIIGAKDLSANDIRTLIDFRKVFEDDKIDFSSKILLAHLEQNLSIGNYFYSSLDESIKKKRASNQYNFLVEHFKIDEFINTFCQQEETRNIFDKSISNLTFEAIKPGMEQVFDDNYKELGHFFRNSYRIVKYINQNSKNDLDFKKTYLGLLRSYYSENVLLAIYYNSVFTRKGLGYAKELVRSDFFGDKDDLYDDNPNHIRKDKLYFGDKDLRTIEKIFTSSSDKLKEVDITNIDDLEKAIISSFNQRS